MWLKWTKRIVAALGILVILVISFAASVVYIYEDEVKQYALGELNKYLKVKVKVPEIDLTLWDQFPNASLRFNDVLIPDYLSDNEKDTMFYAQNIYLEFDFWDMMAGDYKVQKVSMENAIANIFINKEGAENFDIYKSDTSETKESKFSFQLKELSGENVTINYVDSLNKQWYKGYSDLITLTGAFTNEAFDLQIQSGLLLKDISTNNTSYIQNKDAVLDLNLNINNKEKVYSINKGSLSVEELLFDVTGLYQNKLDSNFLDLNIKGKNIDLASAFTIFPDKYLAPLMKYDAKGLVVFDAKIQGLINNDNVPHTLATFYINDGSLTEQSSKVKMKNLSFEGEYDSDRKGISFLALRDIKASIDVGQIIGNVVIEDLGNPRITVKTNGNIDLFDLKKFANTQSIEKLYGKSDFDTYFVLQSKPNGLDLEKAQGNFHFKNTTFKLPTSGITYSDIHGDLVLKQNDAAISNFHGFAEDSDFRLDGVIKNLLPYIFSSKEILTIEADLRTENLNLDLLLDNVSDRTEITVMPNVNSELFELPNNIHLNLKSQIENLTYGKFFTKKIKGIITLQNQILTAKNFSFSANKGTYYTTSSLTQNPDLTFTFNTKLNASGIDIENFFVQMDNFGQEYITDQNIKGRGNISGTVAFLLSNDLIPDEKSLVADIKLDLTKGELINQTSMLEIAEYLDNNKTIKLVIDTEKLKKKMKHVKFKDLHNTITVKDQTIMIPKMTISSNIMDLNIAGTHSFADEIDYHFSFKLRDLYYKNKKQEEFGPLVDDGLGKKLFLRMYGTLEEPKYAIDSKEKHVELKANIEQEKKDVKSILKSELGLFKNDTSIQEYVAPKKVEPTFEIDWEEFDKEEPEKQYSAPSNGSNEKTPKEKSKKKKDKGINKLLKKLGVEEVKEKPAVEMEIENDL